MRLIDADEFKRQVAGMAIANNYPEDKANKICGLIDRQPTAYDVDRVVEQLEGKTYYEYGRKVTWDAIETMESGRTKK